MSNFNVSLNNEGHPVFSFGTSLAGRKIVVDTATGKTHPARALISASRQLAPALTTMLDVLEETTKHRPQADRIEWRLTNNFQELCYRATEFFEVFQKVVPDSLPIVKAPKHKRFHTDFQKIIKDSRKDWSLLCNKIKHNHNYIAPVKQVYKKSYRIVYGFALVYPDNNDAVKLNTGFHKPHERSRTYTLALRQMMHDIFRADKAASRLIMQLTDDEKAEQLPDTELSINIGPDLRRLQLTNLWMMQNERKTLDGFRVTDKHVYFERQQAEEFNEEAQISIQYLGDGFARSFPVI